MAIELKVPSVGESITEVQVGDWLKGVGDYVAQDEPVAMIETDKVSVEVPAPVSGRIAEILVQKGADASVGDVIAMLEPGEARSSDTSPGARTESDSSEQNVAAAVLSKEADAVAAPAASSVPAQSTSPDSSSPDEARIMPAARRVLHDADILASAVTPSGPGGRMLKEDVQVAQRSQQTDAYRAPASLATAVSSTLLVPSGGGSREEELVPMSPFRRRVAERLVQAQQTAALLTTFNEVDMSAVMQLRREYQTSFQAKYGIKLGFMSFFVKAAVEALKEIPGVNAEIRGRDIAYRNYYDIGVAVGGGRGLVVPVIRNAERLGFADVEQAIAEFAVRAKKNTIGLEELQGGTFTISNGGIYGSMLSTPIVNPPQSGILGLHAIQERPVARDGQIVIRPMMYVALTYDHRLVDGREAVTFLKRIKECIEAPSRILLEI